ncbi:uncharacterized protein V1513DRAFT_282646 [Lipomyces chichibuensis]|uniref:uncharacterized protein n=1 Tax=Lipomyces chichibuensis TaxID=1546026 RepID=UPI003343B98D
MFNTFRVSSSSSSGSSAQRPSKSPSRSLFRSRSRQERSDLESSRDGISLLSPPISHVLAANLPVTPSLTATLSTATCSAAARTDPSPSPTPEPALGILSRKRSYFNEDLKVKLMRHCVLHQEGERVSSGGKLGAYLEPRQPDCGKPYKKRREQLRCRSGVAEADTELKQVIDAFMQRFDDVEREEQDLLAKKEDMAEVKAKTKAMRRQMLLGRKRADDEDDEDDDGGGGSGSECAEGASRCRVRNGQGYQGMMC